MKESAKWPSIRSTNEDKGITDAIRMQDGYLKNVERKDLLLIAASIAAKNNLPYDSGINSDKSDTISYANLNNDAYSEYRQYISAIYFLTKGNKDVENMREVNDMTKNFEDYSHRGLLFLKKMYLDDKKGNEQIFYEFVSMLSESEKNQ